MQRGREIFQKKSTGLIFWCFLFFLFFLTVFNFTLAADLDASTTPSGIKFKDMPDNHWAASSVYNCVRLGLTKGYPDGTFRGEQQVNRYELMVFLSNLAISLEKAMDQKIEENSFSNGSGTVSNKVLEELRTEIETLKEQVVANRASGGGSAGNNALQISLDMNIYAGQITVATINEKSFTEQLSYTWLQLTLTRNLDEKTGFVFQADNYNFPNNFQGRIWTTRKFSDNWAMNFEATSGPGQQKMADKRIRDFYYKSLAMGLDSFGVKTNFRYSMLGVTNNAYDIDGDGLKDNLNVDKTNLDFSYKIPTAIPYVGYWTIGYGLEQYYSEKTRNLNDLLRTTRFINRHTFEIVKDVTLEGQYIKEMRSVPTVDIKGDPVHDLNQSIFYIVALNFGDLFKSGTTWALSSAYKGSGFGSNGLKEAIPAVNYLGYASCSYFKEDWDGANRMPSADITTELSAKVRQHLFNNELYLNLAYAQGRALPDKDIVGKENDDTVYVYNLTLVGFEWEINPAFTSYLNYESRALDDSSIDSKKDQYADKVGILGMRLHF